jgi:RNA polymerase-interacting CarD/CdnL/TRCF family regulator
MAEPTATQAVVIGHIDLKQSKKPKQQNKNRRQQKEKKQRPEVNPAELPQVVAELQWLKKQIRSLKEQAAKDAAVRSAASEVVQFRDTSPSGLIEAIDALDAALKS